jgi:hypothetical protein
MYHYCSTETILTFCPDFWWFYVICLIVAIILALSPLYYSKGIWGVV